MDRAYDQPTMQTGITRFVADNFSWVFFALIFLNVIQRRHQPASNRKRFATLYLAILVLVFHLSAIGILRAGLPDAAVFASLALLAGAAWYFRAHVLPFRLTCPTCGTRLSAETILFRDDHLCPTCVNAENGSESRT